MPRPRAEEPPATLTQAELELMQHLWRLERATVHELLEALSQARSLAYTTVSTILRILEKKGFVARHKQGRQHVYSPTLSREAYQERHVETVVDDVFAGDAAALLRRLVSTDRVDERELEEIRALIEERLGR